MFIEPDTYRKFTRIPFDRQANLDFTSDSYDHCRIKNLSLNGMFVMGNFQHQVGENCLINLFQTGVSTDLNLRASAKVVWINDEGMAMEFTSMSLESYMFLQTTLLYDAANSLTLRKELTKDCPFAITDELPISP